MLTKEVTKEDVDTAVCTEFTNAEVDRMLTRAQKARAAFAKLERRGVITTDPANAETCCGMLRDENGFCTHRPGHPIYVET